MHFTGGRDSLVNPMLSARINTPSPSLTSSTSLTPKNIGKGSGTFMSSAKAHLDQITEPKKNRDKENIATSDNITAEILPTYSDFKTCVDDKSIDGCEGVFEEDNALESEALKLKDELYLKKMSLVRQVSCALSKKVNLDQQDDPTRRAILRLAEEVAKEDGEFILKMALHAR